MTELTMSDIPIAPAAKKAKAAPPPKSVAAYISAQIALSDKSQRELANEIGFGQPNIMTMIKQGDCKLPISKIGPIAKALNIDPLYLYGLVMTEYEPETWAILQDDIFGQPVLTQNEMAILNLIRTKATVSNPRLRTAEEEYRLLDAINSLKTDNIARYD